jgi:MFS family permease
MHANSVSVNREPSPIYRWVVLVFVSLAMFGNYYVYDSISPLADLLAKQLRFTDSDIGMLNAIYSLPNIIMVLIGGIIIDRFGTRKSSLIFSILCMIGAVITAISPSLSIMVLGRLIFGLGAESLIVAITTILARWFKGRELSFAFGLNLTIARLGTFTALNSPTWARAYYENWQGPLLISVGAGIISVLCVLIYAGMDLRVSKKYSLHREGAQDKIQFKEIFTFSRSYWLITLLCVTFYSAIFPFQTFAVKFFIQAHFNSLPADFARSMGGFLSSLLILSAMILTPLFGLLADKIGKRATLMMIGSLLLIPVYLVINYIKVDAGIDSNLFLQISDSDTGPQGIASAFLSNIQYFIGMIKILILYYPNLVIPMGIMGLSFSLIPAVMWPSVAYIVDESKLGTAYGLMTMIQNIGLAGLNFIIGWSNDFSGGYTLGMWIFSCLGFMGLLFSWLLRREELGPRGHGLEQKIVNSN